VIGGLLRDMVGREPDSVRRIVAQLLAQMLPAPAKPVLEPEEACNPD
jgi:hypothetical protein